MVSGRELGCCSRKCTGVDGLLGEKEESLVLSSPLDFEAFTSRWESEIIYRRIAICLVDGGMCYRTLQIHERSIGEVT